jgi:hypothetical protein
MQSTFYHTSFKILTSFIVSLFLTQQAHTSPKEHFRGVELAHKTFDFARDDIESSQPGEHSLQNCFVFKNVMVVTIDSHQKGLDRIIVRKNTKGKDVQQMCAVQSWPDDLEIPYNEQYVLGVHEDFLLILSAMKKQFGYTTYTQANWYMKQTQVSAMTFGFLPMLPKELLSSISYCSHLTVSSALTAG